MSTQPRISAPIARVRIRTSEGRRRRASTSGRWKPTEPPCEVEVSESDESTSQDLRPRFYPFPLRAGNDNDE